MLPLSSDTALDAGFGLTATCSPFATGTLVPLWAACACEAAAAALSRLTTVTTASWLTADSRYSGETWAAMSVGAERPRARWRPARPGL